MLVLYKYIKSKEMLCPQKIASGAANLKEMSGAIMKFSMSLAASAVLLIPGMIGVVLLPIAIIAVSAVFFLVGTPMFSNRIRAGARAIRTMSIAIGLFALSMVATTLAFTVIGYDKIGMAALTMVGFAAVFYLIGTFETGGFIKKAALAIGIMSLSMIVLALGIAAMALGIAAAGQALGGGGVAATVVVGARRSPDAPRKRLTSFEATAKLRF